ncbi:MAG: hypothetical protein LC791_00040 [Acidobacteria bacterium]|nr:hypothetical protein [Acidobacteriota bacterium]
MNKLMFVLAMVGCLATVAVAEQSARSRRVLETELVMANADNAPLQQWATSQPGAEFETVTEFRPGQPVIAQARVQGCDPGDSGRCQVTVQYTVYGPDGNVYRTAEARPAEMGKPAPSLHLTFADTDVVGLYRAVTIVRDATAKRMVRSERVFGLRAKD